MGSRSSKGADDDVIERALREKRRPPRAKVLLLGGRNIQFTSKWPFDSAI